MSAALISGWGTAVVGASASASQSSRKLERSSPTGQSLIPVVGLVNKTKDGRALRWQQKQELQHWQQSSRVGASKLQCIAQATKKAVSVSESQFETEVIKSPVPVLVDFWATWCGPCRLMAITLDWAAQHYDGKVKCVKIETDSNQGLVDKYAVYGLPTLMLFVNGEVVPNTHREGALNKEKLKAYLKQNVPALAATA